MQFYIGKVSKYVSVHECKTDGDFVVTLKDEIRLRGAMDTIISDRAKAEVSNQVQEVLRTEALSHQGLAIRTTPSEPKLFGTSLPRRQEIHQLGTQHLWCASGSMDASS